MQNTGPGLSAAPWDLLFDLQACITQRVNDGGLRAPHCPKDSPVGTTIEPEPDPAGDPEVGLDSGDVVESELDWR